MNSLLENTSENLCLPRLALGQKVAGRLWEVEQEHAEPQDGQARGDSNRGPVVAGHVGEEILISQCPDTFTK
jgi:hypothetical protein